MRKEEKNQQIADLHETLASTPHFYVADISGLNAADTSSLRRKCFEQKIKLRVVKNTLLRKALEKLDKEGVDALYPSLEGPTCVLLSEVANAPARLIKDFRKGPIQKPVLKAAYVSESVYLGDDQLDTLATLKSREELIADIVQMLQSPMRNILGALSSPGGNLSGILKTLSER